MNRLKFVCLVVLSIGSIALASEEVVFSPHGGCQARYIKELDAAKKSILIQQYNFTLPDIEQALERAKKRGLDVEVILDHSNEFQKSSMGPLLVRAGIRTLTDAAHPIAHNKIAIIDGVEILGGSFNLTTNAENANAENLTISIDPQLAAQYTANWHAHESHSTPFVQRAQK